MHAAEKKELYGAFSLLRRMTATQTYLPLVHEKKNFPNQPAYQHIWQHCILFSGKKRSDVRPDGLPTDEQRVMHALVFAAARDNFILKIGKQSIIRTSVVYCKVQACIVSQGCISFQRDGALVYTSRNNYPHGFVKNGRCLFLVIHTELISAQPLWEG